MVMLSGVVTLVTTLPVFSTRLTSSAMLRLRRRGRCCLSRGRFRPRQHHVEAVIEVGERAPGAGPPQAGAPKVLVIPIADVEQRVGLCDLSFADQARLQRVAGSSPGRRRNPCGRGAQIFAWIPRQFKLAAAESREAQRLRRFQHKRSAGRAGKSRGAQWAARGPWSHEQLERMDARFVRRVERAIKRPEGRTRRQLLRKG
jgi:hypothetical protein